MSHISFVMRTIGQTQTDKLRTWQKDETAQRTDNQQYIKKTHKKITTRQLKHQEVMNFL